MGERLLERRQRKGVFGMFKTLEQACKALDELVDDTLSEYGQEGVDAAYIDLVEAIAYDCAKSIRIELCMGTLGFIPHWLEKMK